MIHWLVKAALGGAGLLTGYEYFKKRPTHAAASGTGLSGTGSPPANKVAPPGQPQPSGTIALPIIAPVTDSLHNAAAALVQYVNTHSPTQSAFSECGTFQSAYNSANPGAPLQADGKYGPKTRAALQAVIAPALAPADYFPSPGVNVAPPPQPAAPPQVNVDVGTAAQALVAAGSLPKASDSRVTTFQHAYNGHNPAVHLVEDGKYGPLSQQALQSVLDYQGNGGTAPQNPYGAKLATVPAFPG